METRGKAKVCPGVNNVFVFSKHVTNMGRCGVYIFDRTLNHTERKHKVSWGEGEVG